MKGKPGNDFSKIVTRYEISSATATAATPFPPLCASPRSSSLLRIVCWPSCRCKWNTMTLISISHVISSSVPRGCSLESLQPSSITVTSPTVTLNVSLQWGGFCVSLTDCAWKRIRKGLEGKRGLGTEHLCLPRPLARSPSSAATSLHFHLRGFLPKSLYLRRQEKSIPPRKLPPCKTLWTWGYVVCQSLSIELKQC